MRLSWYPGAARNAVRAAAEQLANYQIAAPPLGFYEALADRAEEITNEAIAEAIDARRDDERTILSNIQIARRLLDEIGDSLFLATEQADDPTLARLAAYLLLDGNDGYNALTYSDAWGRLVIQSAVRFGRSTKKYGISNLLFFSKFA